MNYRRGDIFDKSNIVFKETMRNDLRLNGHPMIIPIDIGFTDDFYYFFTVSSQIQHYAADPERYFRLQKGRGTGLPKTSIVDLKHVYKYSKQSHDVRGSLPYSEVSQLLSKFHAYENKNLDVDCQELMGVLV